MIGRANMINAPVIPNRHIVRILPAISDLQIVIVHNQPHEPLQQGF